MSFFQMGVPLVLSTHHRYRSSPSATLRNTLLPPTIGVAPDLAGISSFQAMFSVVLQCSGRSFSVLMPFKEGPRHCGQFSASVGSEATARNTASDGQARTVVLLSIRLRARYSEGYHGKDGSDGVVEAKARDVFEVGNVESPKRCLVGDRARRNGEVDLASAGPVKRPVQLRAERRLLPTKRDGGLARKEGLLGRQLLRQARSAKPFVKHQRGKHDALPVVYGAAQRGCGPFWPGEGIDQHGGVQEGHEACRRPPARRARRIDLNSPSTSAALRFGMRGTSSSNARNRRNLSRSLRRPILS